MIAWIALVGAVVGGVVTFLVMRRQQAAPAAIDADRFAKAFTPVPAAGAGSGAKPPAPAPADAKPSSDGEGGGGSSTMAIKFVPDSSVAPIPGFADIYKKIATGQIRGHIMVVGGPDKGRGVELAGDFAVTVGRDKDHTLNLSDPGVSLHQCEFLVAEGKVILRDAGSKNGTYVNNAKVERHVLENCDIVTCGQTKIMVTLP